MDELHVNCKCGKEWTFTGDDPGRRWEGELFEHHDTALGFCPECLHIRLAKAIGVEDDGKQIVHGVLHESVLTPEEAAEGSARTFNRRLDEAVGLDPDRLTTCDDCGESILHDHKKTGPDAPEVGWEYYECPDCGWRAKPEVVEHA